MASLVDPTPCTNVDSYGDLSVHANTTIQNSEEDETQNGYEDVDK
jgi:hypothetical protein